MKALSLDYITLTSYDDSFKGVKVILKKINLRTHLERSSRKPAKNRSASRRPKSIPHVTFFFSRRKREEPFPGESRLLCPSPKVATYDLAPEMSANDIQDKIIPELDKKSADFICSQFRQPGYGRSHRCVRSSR